MYLKHFLKKILKQICNILALLLILGGVYVGVLKLSAVFCMSELFYNKIIYYSKLGLCGSYSNPVVS